MLSELVGFPTISSDSNLELIDYAEARLKAAGARTRRVPDATGTKANLFAAIGPEAPGGVVLSGHTDVVPVEGQAWSTDPFTLTERDGRLYGRGSTDMKGFLACALAAADKFAAAGLPRPVYFALSHDEEVGCLGAPAMIEAMAAELPPIEAVIVGEPTEMKVVTGHKGLHSFRVELTGKEAHSSLVREGACASTYAIPLMMSLHEEAAAMEAAAPPDSPFDPPFGTLTVGRMGGGEAVNILTGRAWFEFLIRPAPWDDSNALEARLREKAAEVETHMRRYAPEAKVEVITRSNAPPLKPETDGAAEQLARAITGDNQTRVVSFGTEAGQFQGAGLSTVVCGPGSIAQAHQPNEFIEVSQLRAGLGFMDALVKHMAQ
ncbi:MAG: acetylornithine deacetylase [Maricaulaceae bacterium]